MAEPDARDEWPCLAYSGPDGAETHPALPRCFVGSAMTDDVRICADQQECSHRLGGERRRIWARMQELAAHNPDDSAWAYLAEQFTNPEQMLGGNDEP